VLFNFVNVFMYKNIVSSVVVSGVIFALVFGSAGAVQTQGSLRVLLVNSEDEADVLEDNEDAREDARNASRRSRDRMEDEIIVKIKGEKGARKVRVPLGQVDAYVKAYRDHGGDIEYAEPNYIMTKSWTPTDPLYGYQWHFDNAVNGGVHAQDAWQQLGAPGTPGNDAGNSVIVAVVDTGVAYENYTDPSGRKFYKAPDLANTCFVAGKDFVNNDLHANDDESHGTHVTGTIAQSTGNGIGVAGLAFKTCVMPVKVLDKNGSGTYANVAAGIMYAADNGADVINLSLGGPVPGQVIEDAVAYAYNKGVTVVAASGNDNGVIGYPAAYDAYVIAVGATRFDEARAPYSNFGASLDIVAPGGDTSVDQNGDGYGDGVLQQTFNPSTKQRNAFGYWFFQGTSMATPHVAAGAAMVIGNGNATTPDNVRAALQSTADDLGAAGWDSLFGNGLMNLPAALSWSTGPVDAPPSVTIDSPLAGAVISGTAVPITATAVDDIGVVSVNFLVDGVVIGTDAAAPFEATWDSTTASEGNHVVSVTAFDTAGQSAGAQVSVSVDNVNNAPIANAGADKTDVVGALMSFDGSGSSDADGTILSYAWDFGDGATATGVSVSHTYAATGTYAVALIVTDNGGLASAPDTASVTIVSEIEVFADSFEEGEWNGKWSEDSQNDWFRSSQRATAGSFSAEVDGLANNAQLISVPINLQGKTNATISFSWFIESGLDLGEYVAFDTSTDGGTTWIERARIRGDQDPENVWRNENVALSGLSALSLRFRGTMSGSSEDANVDNVRVIAQ